MVRGIAAVTAICLLALLAFTAYMAATTDDLVTPTNGVIGSARVDDPAPGRQGYAALRKRTELQRWRGESGPAPGEQAPEALGAAGEGPATEGTEVAAPAGRPLVEGWLQQRSAYAEILREPEFVEGSTSLPEAVRGVLVQPQGRDWRTAHNRPIAFGGGLYLFGVPALLAIFLAARGRIPVKDGFSGEKIRRFNAFERANHWMTAGSFVVMALTGLVVLYGRALVRPWLGVDVYDGLAEGSAWLHMALVVPFVAGLVVMIVIWTWQNLPSRIDWIWLKRGGGFLSDESETPPAGRFNAGQKLIFWAVVLGGLVLTASGLAMMFPFTWSGYDGMLLAQAVHSITALVMIGIIFGHIYIGTVGMEGAFDAMWSGRVDRNWLREHHSLWYRRFVERSGQAAGGSPAE